MIGYARKFEGNTTMSFKINDSKFLQRYNQIWKMVEKLLKINLNSEPISDNNDKYIKTKIKILGGSVKKKEKNGKLY